MNEDDETQGEDRGEALAPPLPWPTTDHSLTKPDPNWTLNSCIKGWSKDRSRP